jgi:hypothetical protein
MYINSIFLKGSWHHTVHQTGFKTPYICRPVFEGKSSQHSKKDCMRNGIRKSEKLKDRDPNESRDRNMFT